MRYVSTFAVLALVAAAGCSRPAETDAAGGAPAPAGAEAPAATDVAAAVAGPSFAGEWASSFGPMSFALSGGALTGTYGASGGRVRGTVTGDRFTGQWIGPGTTCSTQVDGSDTWGNLEMTLRADGQHFDGRWSYCERPVGGMWNGDRPGTATAPGGSATASAPAAGAVPTATEMRQQSESFMRTALGSYGSGARAGLSDAQLYTPALANLVAWDRTSGRARVAPADPLCMCDDAAGLTLGSVTANMPGMDGNVGVQAVLNGPGGPQTVRYRLEFVPGQGMRIYSAHTGEQGSRYYDGLWQMLNNARRAAS